MAKKIEAKAWREAHRAGLPVPDELATLWARLDALEAETEALNRESVTVTAATSAVVRGESLTEAVDSERTATVDSDLLAVRRRTAGTAGRMLRDRIAEWVASHREQLIGEYVRPYVAELVAQAIPLAATLADFAPTFDATRVAEDASPAQLKAWRTSRELNERFTVVADAWLSSWLSATGSAAGGKGVPGWLRVDAPGGLHAWERPEEVSDLDVRDGRVVDLLSVARHAHAGFRLATGQEMLDLTARQFTTRPHLVGERHPRGVLLPSDPPKQAIPEVRRGPRAVFF